MNFTNDPLANLFPPQNNVDQNFKNQAVTKIKDLDVRLKKVEDYLNKTVKNTNIQPDPFANMFLPQNTPNQSFQDQAVTKIKDLESRLKKVENYLNKMVKNGGNLNQPNNDWNDPFKFNFNF